MEREVVVLKDQVPPTNWAVYAPVFERPTLDKYFGDIQKRFLENLTPYNVKYVYSVKVSLEDFTGVVFRNHKDDPRFWISLLNDTMVLFGGLQDIPLKEFIRWDSPNVQDVFNKVSDTNVFNMFVVCLKTVIGVFGLAKFCFGEE